MRESLKILKGLFFFIMALIMVGCAGIMVCAFNPSLTAMLAKKVEGAAPAQSAGSSGISGIGSLLQTGDREPEDAAHDIEQPGVNADWLEGLQGYEQPDRQPVEAPDAVSDRMGYEPVQEEASEIGEDEAESLTEGSGDTGDGLVFDETIYPYYAMLEPDMRQIYSQIYANALELNVSFAPVTAISVSQLKTVFEAVYNDHPELFWLDTGYSCKYIRSGRCAEITLKYNSTVNNLEEAKAAFEGAAVSIVGQAQGQGGSYEKEKYVHDALVQMAEYDLSAPMNQSAYSALVGGKSVCAGYARAFQYMMQLLGIPCYYCTGYAGEDHAWDIVKLDDKYYNVDVTWGDTEVPTYNYFNKSDRELAATHMRTGLSVYLPACADSAGTEVSTQGNGSGGADQGTGANEGITVNPDAGSDQGSGTNQGAGTEEDAGDTPPELINPNPIKPLTWQSKVIVDPTSDQQTAADEQKQENLRKAGITEEQVRDTMKEYYEDCGKLLKEAGKGDKQFTNVIPKHLWEEVERAYNNGDYWKAYVETALKDLGAEEFVIQLQAQDLGGGYYRIYHNVYTY